MIISMLKKICEDILGMILLSFALCLTYDTMYVSLIGVTGIHDCLDNTPFVWVQSLTPVHLGHSNEILQR